MALKISLFLSILKVQREKNTTEEVENLKLRTVEKVPINSATHNVASWLEHIILRNPF